MGGWVGVPLTHIWAWVGAEGSSRRPRRRGSTAAPMAVLGTGTGSPVGPFMVAPPVNG